MNRDLPRSGCETPGKTRAFRSQNEGLSGFGDMTAVPGVGPEWFEANRAWWDERAPLHVGGDFYEVDAFLSGTSALRDFELSELGDVAGRTLCHPQCHFGLDTLSWAGEGAIVSGLDFSPEAIDAASALAERAGIDARFVCADVYDASQAFGSEQFDIVYTGLGAINWLPDIDRWAATMASLCVPGGALYLVEFHPTSNSLEDESLVAEARIAYGMGHIWHDEILSGSYGAEGAATLHNETWERVWTLGEVLSAIAGAGFRIEFLHEFDYTLYRQFPWLIENGRHFERPPEVPSFPMMYSLLAHLDR